jgi:hypothetical protein
MLLGLQKPFHCGDQWLKNAADGKTVGYNGALFGNILELVVNSM